ncbi:hypothetical protein IG197_27380 [Aminobacter sp. SR38]|jgi:predicted P-loop ATPase|uniref:phage NrS-1 polymerase family protein n=1 Tax=Aminobacter sp. SR38 TaxID=2774562 RepID=UPI001785FB12|nr:VapE domain-containing protein [Aminobacter sp. SR38]QOF71425.1 hypothetical protein IG197_27380 [Aminobacter sp. SR38]
MSYQFQFPSVDPLASLPPRFITYRTQPREGGKLDKIPLDKFGNPSDCNDPENWTTYADVKATGRPIGFVFAGDGIVALDPDSCRDPATGAWHPDAINLFALFPGALTEISLSGTGGHIFGKIDNPDEYAAKGSVAFGGLTRVDWFNRTGFIAFSEFSKQGSPLVNITGAFASVVQQSDAPGKALDLPVTDDPRWTLGHLSTAEIVEKMLASNNSLKVTFGDAASISDLWSADAAALAKHFPHEEPCKPYDRSVAHMSLMGRLAFWFGRNPARMAEAFGMSKLAKDGKWQRQAYRTATLRNALRSPGPVYDKPMSQIAQASSGGDWRSLIGDDNREARGTIRANHANTLTAFRNDPRLKETLAYDEMATSVMLMGWLPMDRNAGTDRAIRPINDADISHILEYLQLTGMPKLSADTVHRAAEQFARERSYHPVRDWLSGLQWDGNPRLDSWLTDYLGAEASTYTSTVGRMWLISAVARVMRPGCKVDSMLILEGSQGLRKSTVPATLAGPWYSDGLPNVQHGGKDLSQHLAGKWIIELAEMAATSKAEAETLKSFITRQVERYRRPFARCESEEPRQCVFIGTTNQAAYLRDETGARRFWPVGITRCDIEALERDREQLFAEAVTLFSRGEKWWPDSAAERLIAEQTEERFDADPWEDQIREYVRDKSGVLVGHIAEELGIPRASLHQGVVKRILAILVGRLKWRKGKRNAHGQPYVRTAESPA